MSVKETHAVLQQLPISELGAALVVAMLDNARDNEPVSAVYGLLAVAQVMAEQLTPVDQMLCALQARQMALDLLPAQPVVRQNGHRVELVK